MRPRRLTYAGISLSLNVLDAIDALLAMPGRRWSHFIPLSGADYPLLPPAEMQDVLAAAAKRAERDLSFVEAWRGNGTQRWRRPALDPALWNAEGPLAVIDYPWTWVRPSRPVPHGPAWVVLSRRACEAALQGPGMRRVLATLGGVEAPDESLWQMFFLWTEEGRRMQGTLAGDCLRYDEPTDGESHVKWLRTEGQLEAALASGALFARKLEPGSALIDMIDGMSEERRSKVRRAVDGRVGRAVDWLPGARAGK
ncbi:hypothetical protein DFJ74DRAFT_664224 [Hyaloraphidium curvatum]|nr:hypothetical protein DFJ74DRAFT_664224 [Hyaloraphidium curvatum]